MNGTDRHIANLAAREKKPAAVVGVGCGNLRHHRPELPVVVSERGASHQRAKPLRLDAAHLLIVPLLLARGERVEVFERAPKAPTVGGLVAPEIDADMLAQLRERYQCVEVEDAVAPSLRAFEFERLASVRLDLSGNALLLRRLQNALRQVTPPDEEREGRGLNVDPRAVVVLGGALFFPVLAIKHPL